MACWCCRLMRVASCGLTASQDIFLQRSRLRRTTRSMSKSGHMHRVSTPTTASPGRFSCWRNVSDDPDSHLQMMRHSAYSELQGRIVPEQFGWAAGYGTGDIGLTLQTVIQQCRRLRPPLYILYLDLATLFPKIDREIGTVAEILRGLPTEAAWAVAGCAHLRRVRRQRSS